MVRSLLVLSAGDATRPVESREPAPAEVSDDALLDAYSRAVVRAAELVGPAVVAVETRGRTVLRRGERRRVTVVPEEQ